MIDRADRPCYFNLAFATRTKTRARVPRSDTIVNYNVAVKIRKKGFALPLGIN